MVRFEESEVHVGFLQTVVEHTLIATGLPKNRNPRNPQNVRNPLPKNRNPRNPLKCDRG